MLDDIFEWDTVNWSRHIAVWKEAIAGLERRQIGLEIGGRGGGLALWMALAGLKVICSYYDEDMAQARRLHEAWKVAGKVAYERIDVLEMEFRDRFDVIMMKSTLGGLGGAGAMTLQRRAIEHIHAALRPGGVFLFAENVAATSLHAALRRVKRGRTWRYPTLDEIELLFAPFREFHYRTTGVVGGLGLSERQRRLLSYLDGYLSPLVPPRWHYVCIGAAKK